MKSASTELPGVIVIDPLVHRDSRGFFLETYHSTKYSNLGLPSLFVQDNHSRSSYGTLRGLHAQLQHPQGKLVRVIEGEVFDVAVDIRPGSGDFGRWFGVTLSAETARQIYIPPGFAHGFCVTSEFAQVEYKCTDFYCPGDEINLKWNDPDLGITWPIGDPLLSPKDANGLSLSDLRRLLTDQKEKAA